MSEPNAGMHEVKICGYLKMAHFGGMPNMASTFNFGFKRNALAFIRCCKEKGIHATYEGVCRVIGRYPPDDRRYKDVDDVTFWEFGFPAPSGRKCPWMD